MSRYYQYLKIPQIDKQYLIKIKDTGHELAEDLIKNPNKVTSADYQFPYNRQVVGKMWENEELSVIGHNEYIGLDNESYAYVEHLLEPYKLPGLNLLIHVFVNVQGQPSYIPPHCDNDREFSINYNIEQGGTNVITSWHKKYIDTPAVEGEFYGPGETSKEIESVKIRNREWHLFHATTPHSIRNIESARINLLVLTTDSMGNIRDRIPNINFTVEENAT